SCWSSSTIRSRIVKPSVSLQCTHLARISPGRQYQIPPGKAAESAPSYTPFHVECGAPRVVASQDPDCHDVVRCRVRLVCRRRGRCPCRGCCCSGIPGGGAFE